VLEMVLSVDNIWVQLLSGSLGWVLAIYPAGQAPAPVDREFPVASPASYGSTHHDYPATDIFAACGSPVVAPVDAVVLEVGRRDRWDPSTDRGAARGGKFVSLRGRDGVRYYGSHLARIPTGVAAGAEVRAGQRVGRVGHTGSARSTPCHLHFGISPVCRGTGQWWIRRGVVNPYRFLNRWRSGRHLSPARAVSRWKLEHGCPSRP
jgi:peptidoglycan LD-endopeptidase LytH